MPHLRWVRQRGFTFIELLIAAAIFVVIGAVLMVSLVISKRSFMSADASIQVQEQARKAYDIMTKELRQAGNVNNNQPAVNVPRLDFQVVQSYDTDAPPDGCSGICWGDGATQGRWVHYLVSNSKLYRCPSAGQNDAIANFTTCTVLALNVQNFSANYSDTNRTVTLSLETKISSAQLAGGSMGIAPAPLTTYIKLRNDSSIASRTN